MSLSYAKQVKKYCDRYDMTMVDTSTLIRYEVTLTAPDDCVLWGTDSETYTIRQARKKGSRKDKFWDIVGAEASTGTIHKDALSVRGWTQHVEWNVPVKN